MYNTTLIVCIYLKKNRKLLEENKSLFEINSTVLCTMLSVILCTIKLKLYV